MKNNRKIFLQFIAIGLIVAFAISCRSPEPKVTESPSTQEPPTAHVWQYMYAHDFEDIGYAAYSYVLVGRDESNPVASSLYFELVKAIQGSTVRAESIPDNVSKAHFNLFLIPAVGDRDAAFHEPNYELSKLLLTLLSVASPIELTNPGPYIITLPKPISMGDRNEVADILYVDLTHMHQAAIPEVVRTYKNKIFDKKLNGIEKLQSLRLSLLNAALITEDSIGFAKAAYAELRKYFVE
ncbi:MAG: hypothetical protein AMJ53_12860 [Gammaproteobacteria bacterium SG8_11]|nr:MAG: hypothetical protein AMJ53_12860 [Gammaproteobacteria bacterium SG8_11]